MAIYGTGKRYGTGVLYGSRVPVIQLWKVNNSEPDKGIVARHIKLTINYTGSGKFTIATIRTIVSRKDHVIPKWLAVIRRNVKRTKVTVHYSGSDLIRLDSIRLRQRIRERRPVV